MESYIGPIENVLKKLSKYVCILAGWILIFISLMICSEVVLRKVFSQSLQGIDEYGGYALALSAALGMAYAYYESTHIRIDVLIRLLPKPFRVCSGLLALCTLLGVAVFFAYITLSHTIESWQLGSFSNTPLRTPLYLPQGIWTAGFFLFVVALIVRFLLLIEMAIRRQKSELLFILDSDQEEKEIKTTIEEITKQEHGDTKLNDHKGEIT